MNVEVIHGAHSLLSWLRLKRAACDSGVTIGAVLKLRCFISGLATVFTTGGSSFSAPSFIAPHIGQAQDCARRGQARETIKRGTHDCELVGLVKRFAG